LYKPAEVPYPKIAGGHQPLKMEAFIDFLIERPGSKPWRQRSGRKGGD